MATQVPILTYHKISPVDPKSIYPGTFVPPRLFEKHLRHLSRRRFESIPLASLFSPTSPAKPIVLTFDDGFQDFEDSAWPLLQKYGMMGTVFLVSEFIGLKNQWDIAVGDVAYPLMARNSILRLHGEGIEFGSHTRTHARLTSLNPASQEDEIAVSKQDLETRLGFSIDTLCYPYGSFDDTSLELARSSGYRFATSCEKGLNDGTEDPMRLKRIAIRNDTSLPVFVYKLWRAFRLGR